MPAPKGTKEYEIWRQKLSESHMGHVVSDLTKQKISIATEDKNNPFYGKHHTEESKNKNRKAHLGKHLSEEHKEKIRKALKKIFLSKSVRDRISINTKNLWHNKEWREKVLATRKGIVPWNKGLTADDHPSIRKSGLAISEANKGRKVSIETREKIRNSLRGRKYDKNRIKNMMRRRIPTSLELKFQGIIDEFDLPYRYVGNGSFVIENCNPDFINTNNKKIAIEVYSRYYKRKNHKDINEWKIQRKKVFDQHGWNLIYFDETEVNGNWVLTKLGRIID